MSKNSIIEWWKTLTQKMNENGVPLPMVRDPLTKIGSVSLTLVVVSAFFVMTGIVLDWIQIKGIPIDISNALQFFYASCFLYFGRNIPVFGKSTSEPTKTQPKVDNPDAP